MLLAKSPVQTLERSSFLPLYKAALRQTTEEITDPAIPEEAQTSLRQDHRYVEGSLEEKVRRIRDAFYNWQDTEEGYCYILAIFDDSVLYVSESWRTDGTHYYRLPYTYGADKKVTLQAEAKKAVDVAIVVRDLGITQSEDPTPETTIAETPATGEETPSADAAPTGTDAPTTTQAEEPPTVDPRLLQSALTEVSEAKRTLTLLQGNARAEDDTPFFRVRTQSIEGTGDAKTLRIEGVATVCNIINKNGYVYPKEVWQANLDRMNVLAQAGRFTGEVEHPEIAQGLRGVAIRFDKFWMEENEVLFEGVVIPTIPHGVNLQTLLENKVQVDLSSRGYGTIKQGEWQGRKNVPIVQADFVCTDFDAVKNGAAPGSEATVAEQQSVQQDAPTAETISAEMSDQTTEEASESTEQSEGNKVEHTETTSATPATQSETTPAATPAAPVTPAATATPTPATPVTQSADQIVESAIAANKFAEGKAAFVAQATGLSAAGKAALQRALDRVPVGDLTGLVQAYNAALPLLQDNFPATVEGAENLNQSTSTVEWNGTFLVKQSKEEKAPKNGAELIDRLIQNVPDRKLCTGTAPDSKFTSLRESLRAVLTNIARTEVQGFSGRAAMRALLRLEQGRKQEAQDILTQAYDSTTAVETDGNADPGGAPVSNVYIFPLVTAVWPKLFLAEIASIQPLDRPDGKIFWLDLLRNEDPSAGQTKRIDQNTSSNPFNSSYANRTVEGSKPKRVAFRLRSESVRVTNKALGGEFPIEEMQDLRAYHDLDAAVLLLEAMSREIAIERNSEVLDALYDNATGGALTFNKTKPSGWDQKDWDEYIWTYIASLENRVFSKRQGGLTHLIVGMDAALALSKSQRVQITFDGNGDGEMYPGTTFYGNAQAPNGSRYRIFKTNFWNLGTERGATIMGIRKGMEFGDTPVVYAPYTMYMAPQFVDPTTMAVQNGVMDRSATKTVITDNVATLEVAAGTGVEL
jgi:hypothetical protein